MERLGYVPALDGLRAVAIALVVGVHATGFPPGGGLGVDVFFVLSGFLITTILLEERMATGSVSFRAFYRRRAYRLLPALFVMLAAYLLFSIVRSDDVGRSLFGVAAGVGYFSNLVLAFDSSAMPDGLWHLWSLAAEEQFYLLWPIVLFGLLKARVGVATVLVVGAVVATQLRVFMLYAAEADRTRLGFGVDTRSVSILLGCLLALVMVNRILRPRILEPFLILALIGLAMIPFGTELAVGPPFVVGVVTALLIACVMTPGSHLAALLSMRPVVFLGVLSYSLYLWHFPIFVALGVDEHDPGLLAIPAVALALIFAVGSYYLVERPFLRRKRAPSPRHPKPSVGGKLASQQA